MHTFYPFSLFSIFFFNLFITFHIQIHPVSSSTLLPPPTQTIINCSTNPSLPDNFFDGCYKDTSTQQIPSSFANTFWSFFNGDAYSIYTTFFIIIISFVPDQHFTPFLDFSRLHAIFLLFQVGWVNGLDPFLYTLFRQERPCICTFTTGKSSQTFQIGSEWGMPSGDVMSATVFALAFTQRNRKRIPLALIFILCAILERLLLGFHSLGQTLTGASLGFLFHFYFSYTPLYFRVFDIAVNIIAGVVTTHYIHLSYPEVNFGFSTGLFNGYIWMLLATMFLLLFYPRLFSFFPKNNIQSYYSPYILQGYYLFIGTLGYETRILDSSSSAEHPKFVSLRSSISSDSEPIHFGAFGNSSYGALNINQNSPQSIQNQQYTGSFGFGEDGANSLDFFSSTYNFDSSFDSFSGSGSGSGVYSSNNTNSINKNQKQTNLYKRFFSSSELGRAFPPLLSSHRRYVLILLLFVLFIELSAIRWASPYIAAQI